MTAEYHHPEEITSTRSETLKLALEAAGGQAVFPLQGKVPAFSKCSKAKGLTGTELANHAQHCSGYGHGVYDASRDRSRITGMFNAAPSATGYGTATGAASGILVVDVDGPEAVAEAERRGLRSGYVVRTGRERDGWHLYFTIPSEAGTAIRSRTLAPGLEVKGEGSYVVGPGSLHPSGAVYHVVRSGEPAPAPAWLLEAGAKPEPVRVQHPRSDRGPVAVDVAGPPIPEGGRNRELTRIAGRLHDGSRDLEALTRELEAVNAARCNPPLELRELERIAASIHARTPCNPSRTSIEATPEVLEALDTVEAQTLAAFGWSRMADHTDYDVLLALCRIARRHGQLIPAGVRVEASVREIALEAAVGSTRTISKATNRLRRAGRIRRDGGTKTGPKRGAFVILTPRAKGNTHPLGGVLEDKESASVSPCAPPRSAPRLRWSAPGHGGRLNKRRGRIIDALEAAGDAWTDTEALADALAGADGKRPRPRDLERRTLPPLLETGVVDCDSGRYRLAAEWRDALDRRRDEDGEIAAARLQKLRDEEAREGFREAWRRGEVVSKAEFARQRRDRTRIRPEERTPSGTVAELERVPAPDPALVGALREYLRSNPRRFSEGPSWLSVALWAGDHVVAKPSPEAVAVALVELGEFHAA